MPTKLDYNALYLPFKKGPAPASHYPLISNVQATTQGLVTWITDIPSTSQVNYGLTPNLGNLTTHDGTLVTSRSVQLSGLSPSILYYFRVQSFYLDSVSISDLYTFTSLGAILQEDGTYILQEDGTKILLEP